MQSIFKEAKVLSSCVKKYVQDNFPAPKYIHNYSQAQIVRYLFIHQDSEISQNDLCQQLDLKKATIAENIQDLEKRGVIQRTESTHDKRKKVVHLTPDVLKSEKEMCCKFAEMDQRMIQNIDQSDLDIFLKVLKQMEMNLK